MEDHLQYARRFYNGSVRILNTRIQSFPSPAAGSTVRVCSQAEFFEADDQARASVEVKLSLEHRKLP